MTAGVTKGSSKLFSMGSSVQVLEKPNIDVPGGKTLQAWRESYGLKGTESLSKKQFFTSDNRVSSPFLGGPYDDKRKYLCHSPKMTKNIGSSPITSQKRIGHSYVEQHNVLKIRPQNLSTSFPKKQRQIPEVNTESDQEFRKTKKAFAHRGFYSSVDLSDNRPGTELSMRRTGNLLQPARPDSNILVSLNTEIASTYLSKPQNLCSNRASKKIEVLKNRYLQKSRILANSNLKPQLMINQLLNENSESVEHIKRAS